jgi:hypothetical protein
MSVLKQCLVDSYKMTMAMEILPDDTPETIQKRFAELQETVCQQLAKEGALK